MYFPPYICLSIIIQKKHYVMYIEKLKSMAYGLMNEKHEIAFPLKKKKGVDLRRESEFTMAAAASGMQQLCSSFLTRVANK